MLVCDAHCDLPLKVLDDGQKLCSNTCHWSLDRLPENSFLQVFAHWVDIQKDERPFLRAKQMITRFLRELEENQDRIGLVLKGEDIDRNLAQGKACAMLSIEGGEALEGNLEHLSYFFDLGIRMMTLTWNHENELGEGVGEETRNKGLTDFGRMVVGRMEKLGMFVDVSHLTERGFWFVAETAKKPFVASHSNSYAICPHKRNLTDEQFIFLKEHGGMCGINLCPLFLNLTDRACVTDVVRHIEHFMALGGENSVMLGCDLDGIDDVPQDITDLSRLNLIWEELGKLNYSEDVIAKIAGRNWYNLVKFAF